MSTKYARCAENGCTTAQCGVNVAHSQYMGGDAVDNSPSESFVALAVGDPPRRGSASFAAAQLPGDWARLQVGNKQAVSCSLIAIVAVCLAQHLSSLHMSSPSFLLAFFVIGKLD